MPIDRSPSPVPARWRGWGRWGVVRVRGRSMTPTLREGDLLLVRWDPRPATVGDVVVVRLPEPYSGRLAVKRLVSRQDGGWWVERDNPAQGVDSWLVGAIEPPDQAGVVIVRIAPRPGRIAKRSQ